MVYNVLVDTGSALDIIFSKAFKQMQELKDVLLEATNPLCGIGRRQIVALDKIQMLVTFSYINNTRTKNITFHMIDMDHPYKLIIGGGTLNAFKDVVHSMYLCMNIAGPYKLISMHGGHKEELKVAGQ